MDALSIIIPVRNEEANIAPLCARIEAVALESGFTGEIVFVDDHSSDRTAEAILSLMAQSEKATRRMTVRYVGPPHPKGKDHALVAGLVLARYDTTVLMDGDLQNCPEDIPLLIEKLNGSGAQMAAGYRTKRSAGTFTRGVSRFANLARVLITGYRIRDAGCALKAFRTAHRGILVDATPLFHGFAHCFYSSLFLAHRLSVTEVPVRDRPRTAGVSKFHRVKGRVLGGLFSCVVMRRHSSRCICQQ